MINNLKQFHEIGEVKYIPVILIIGLFLWFIWKKWDFFKGVLSDGIPVMDKNGEVVKDKDGNPIFLGSATRVMSLLFGLTIMMCEIFTTIKTESFDLNHLITLVLTILILVGLLKAVDAISIVKGREQKQND